MTHLEPGVLSGVIAHRTPFEGREGRLTLVELFAGHRRLAIHHTVPERALPWPRTAPSREPAALRDPGTRLVLVSRAPYSMLEQYRQFLGGELPCYSAPDGVFGDTDPGEPWEQVPVLSLFHREGTTVVHVGTAPALGLTARPAAQTARS